MVVSSASAENPLRGTRAFARDGGNTRISDRAKFYIFLSFLACVSIPGFISAGVNLAPYRIFLIAMAIPTIYRVVKDQSIRFTGLDAIMLLAIAWPSIAIAANHFPGHAVLTVSLFLDASLSYLFGRVFIRNSNDFAIFFKALLLLAVAVFPFVIIESFTGQRVLRDIFSLVLNTKEAEIKQYRFGLLRVKLGFGHAVLFGFFFLVAFANIVFIFWENRWKSLAAGTFIAVCVLFAISSSSFIGLGLLLILILSHIVIVWLSIGWGTAIYVLGFSSIFLSILSGFNYFVIVDFVIQNLMFSHWSGMGRANQISLGMVEVYNNPIFGIGQHGWRPAYWQSASVDSYWLSGAMKFGIPAVFFLALYMISSFIRISFSVSRSRHEYNIKVGYLITLVVVAITLVSVSVYHSTESYLFVFLAAGVWFYNPETDRRTSGRRPPLVRKQSQGQAGRSRPAGDSAAVTRVAAQDRRRDSRSGTQAEDPTGQGPRKIQRGVRAREIVNRH